MTRRFVSFIVTTIAAAAIHAQTPRDPSAPAAAATATATSGSATVSGVVMSADTPPKPLRRVTVSLVAQDFRVPFSTVTDDNGRWTMTSVPAGYYGVVASKPSYLGAFYGSTRPGRGPGVPVAVADGARVSNLSVTLVRGGVIAGLLRLPTGQAANNMAVSVAEVETVAGVRRLRLTGGRASTNDRGEFRVYGLPAGDYIVQAQPSGLLTGALTNTNDASQTTAADVSWAQQIAQRGRAAAGGSTTIPAAPPRDRTVNYATVYFPGTTEPSAAAVVSLGTGEERRGIDFALALVATARVSGVVVGADGQPMANAQVSLVTPDAGLNLLGLLTSRTPVKSGADGSFTLTAVPPGRYQLWARATLAANNVPAVATPAMRTAVQTMASAAGGDASSGDLWAQQDLAIDGHDVAGVALALQPGLTVRGRLVFDGTSIAAPAAADFSRARVTLAPALGGNGAADAISAIASSASGAVSADGSFVVTGLAPNVYRLSIAMPGIRAAPRAPAGGWTLRSVMSGSVDLSEQPLDLRARQSADGVVATFTDRPTQLTGSLVDQSNQALTGYPIVVFSTNRSAWNAASRRVAIARPSTDGSFRLVGLPAGAYFLCAVVNLDPSDLEDPMFLEQLSRTAITITLADGATVTQNLRIAGR